MINIFKSKMEQIQERIKKLHADIMAQLKVIEDVDSQITAITASEEVPASGIISSLWAKKQEAEIIIGMIAKKRMAALKELDQSRIDDNVAKKQKLQTQIDGYTSRIEKLDEQRKKLIAEVGPIEYEHTSVTMDCSPRPLSRVIRGADAVNALEDPFTPIANPVAYRQEINRLVALQTKNRKSFNDEFIGYWEDDIEVEGVKGKRPILFTRTGVTVPTIIANLGETGEITEMGLTSSIEYIDFKETRKPGEFIRYKRQ